MNVDRFSFKTFAPLGSESEVLFQRQRRVRVPRDPLERTSDRRR